MARGYVGRDDLTARAVRGRTRSTAGRPALPDRRPGRDSDGRRRPRVPRPVRRPGQDPRLPGRTGRGRGGAAGGAGRAGGRRRRRPRTADGVPAAGRLRRAERRRTVSPRRGADAPAGAGCRRTWCRPCSSRWPTCRRCRAARWTATGCRPPRRRRRRAAGRPVARRGRRWKPASPPRGRRRSGPARRRSADDFFLDLGGHSLLAARVVSALRADPDLAHARRGDVYRHPTVEALARHAVGRRRSRLPRIVAPPVAGPTAARRGTSPLRAGPAARPVPRRSAFASLQWLGPFLVYAALIAEGWPVLPAAAGRRRRACWPSTRSMLAVGVGGQVAGRRPRAGRAGYPLWGVHLLPLVARPGRAGRGADRLPGRHAAPRRCTTACSGRRSGRNVYLGTDEVGCFDLLDDRRRHLRRHRRGPARGTPSRAANWCIGADHDRARCLRRQPLVLAAGVDRRPTAAGSTNCRCCGPAGRSRPASVGRVAGPADAGRRPAANRRRPPSRRPHRRLGAAVRRSGRCCCRHAPSSPFLPGRGRR